ncbi:nitrogen fixation protein NifM [Reinekea thalattae]|uniref:peptidylprolyl isomerase n=1 Tax=Reinekea thalattae TaxID=2593301 RepID=A0A5C8Z5Z5_9GAMM|nr:nitrogen fixation protein NifM [Reinekea thalattae]TXR53037.1 nitrogen fixation protein NifM [Reinekea thalattae]
MSTQANLEIFQANASSALAPYLTMKTSLDLFGRIASELDSQEKSKLQSLVAKQLLLIKQIVASQEADAVTLSEIEIARAMKELESRFPDSNAFQQTLLANKLTKEDMRKALTIELLSEAVLDTIADDYPRFSEAEAKIYYQNNIEKFEQPERREASHILITINDQFAENKREAAHKRMQDILYKLTPDNFAQMAERHSECPTAMNQGHLGLVSKGLLHTELDCALFAMNANSLSYIIETEAGFHILFCQKIQPAHRVEFEQAKEKIIKQHNLLAKKRAQKNWMANLMSQL